MTVPPRLREFALTVLVASSVGWLGAVVAFPALAVVGLTSQDAQTVRATSLVTAPAAWSVLVPLNLASLLSGLGSSLATTWGLFRHDWVLIKLLLNVAATIFVLGYAQTLGDIVGVAADPTVADDDFVLLGTLQRASGGLLLLLLATVLAVYEPRGMTRYGQRKRQGQRRKQPEQRTAPVPEMGPHHHALQPIHTRAVQFSPGPNRGSTPWDLRSRSATSSRPIH